MRRLGSSLRRALARVGKTALSRVVTAIGRSKLLRGDVEGAVASFDKAARLAPALFDPWLHLARAHLRAHDLFRARRALARAREADARRFEREAPVRVRAEGYELSALADVTSPGRMEVPERQAAVLHARERTAGALPFGDCRDLDEYARFRSMPPITSGEIEEIDWDEVSEDLQDG